ncbi:hypothetical protein DRE_01120 [Drechslerella stenobrocha 248]|uniref:Uncharacterized protein n=1 Tax=Drechslerella stenobrocha 248 TaxID=1043628 RepID=W7HMF4_9PEZI|nr:hypothetical protein DRE_01120 [Drechslerella stenobrocha 248]
MSQTSNAELPVLPAVEQALSPFIRPPAEVSLIRRHLASTLDTLIAASASPTPSLTAQRAVRCLTGTRKAYYAAAVENRRLRKQWADLAADIAPPVAPAEKQDAASNTGYTPAHAHTRSGSIARIAQLAAEKEKEKGSEWTLVYDQVLELRRVFSQLTVLGKYQQRITALARSRERPLPAVFAEYAQQMPPPPPGGPLAAKEGGGGGGGNAGAGTWDEEVLLPLEKAVVDAQVRLEAEKSLLEKAKEAADREGVDTSKLPEAVRTLGMMAAKEELEVWLDEQLRLAGEGSGTPRKERGLYHDAGGGAGGNGKFDLDQQLEEIKEVYGSYVASREKMLHAFLLASQPVKKEMIPPKIAKDRGSAAGAAGSTAGKSEIPALLGVLDELGHWKGRMDELTELMKAMKEGSANAARDLEVMMGKLRSESQLLDNYGGAGVQLGRPATGDVSPFQSSIELAKAWELAAEEAEKSMMVEVRRDTAYAQERLSEVDELLAQLRELLPAVETVEARSKEHINWRGLRGNVGFDDGL